MLGEKGILPALVAVAAMTLLSSWWFSRKIRIERINVNIWNMWREASALLKLGLALMSSGLMTMGVAYVIRLTILRKLGFQATGLYQSAWTLGGLYVGFILQAMGADFYPRLTAVAHDNEECNRLVNEQTEIGILMAGPGVLATLTFARLVLTLLYSAKFIDAVPILRWLSIGTVLQVITWPIGFVVIAKAKQKIFFLCEAAWTIVSLALAWICVSAFGLVGAGIAFFGSYVFHGIMIYIVVHRLTGFEWTRGNKQMISLYMVSIAVVFCAFSFLSFATALCIGVIAVIISSVYSVRTFINVVSIGKMRMFLHRIRLRTSSVLLNGPN
jgi:PST family polysaccharide transporter